MNARYRIATARGRDVSLLPAIERAALALFAQAGEWTGGGSLGEVNDEATFEQARRRGHLWVAIDDRDRPVGFALVEEIDGDAHLDELDVHPDHNRQGIGSALVRTVCAWARDAGHRAITLSTFRDVPWNGPYYARLGFRVLAPDELGPGLAALVEVERAKGLSMDRRVMMRREVESRDGAGS